VSIGDTTGTANAPRRPQGKTSPPYLAAEAPGMDALAPGRTTPLLPAGVIRDDEVIILLLRPSLLFVPLSCLVSLPVIALAAFCLAYLARWQPTVAWTDTQAFALGVALAAVRLGWQAAQWYCHLYVLTDRRVIRRLGVLRVAVFEARLKNIQHTSVFARLRERLFGLGSIGFATSGTDVIEAWWLMLRQPFDVHRTIVDAIQRYGK